MGDLKGGDVSAGRGVTRRRMKEDWDDRAREDVYRYVDHRANTDEELHTLGVQDTELLLADVGAFLRPDHAAVEIGCGPGRLLVPMASRFREVWGTDVSKEMIEMAQRRVAPLGNVRALETGGDGLEGVPSGYFEFCYSSFVFECIPERSVISRYVEEAHRVLKPGGFLKFNAAGVYPRNPFRAFYDANLNTWSGLRFTMSDIVKLTEDAGFEVLWTYHGQEVAPAYQEAHLDVEYRIWVVGRKGSGMDEFESVCWAAGQALKEAVPPGAAVIVGNPEWTKQFQVASLPDLRFLGMYSADDGNDAIRSLEELRHQGGQYLLLTRYAMWWEESYPELFRYLDTRYRELGRTDDYLLVDLTASGTGGPKKASSKKVARSRKKG